MGQYVSIRDVKYYLGIKESSGTWEERRHRCLEAIRQMNRPNINTPWPDKVVWEVFSGEDLETLPKGILEQMRNHLNETIISKEEVK